MPFLEQLIMCETLKKMQDVSTVVKHISSACLDRKTMQKCNRMQKTNEKKWTKRKVYLKTFRFRFLEHHVMSEMLQKMKNARPAVKHVHPANVYMENQWKSIAQSNAKPWAVSSKTGTN